MLVMFWRQVSSNCRNSASFTHRRASWLRLHKAKKAVISSSMWPTTHHRQAKHASRWENFNHRHEQTLRPLQCPAAFTPLMKNDANRDCGDENRGEPQDTAYNRGISDGTFDTGRPKKSQKYSHGEKYVFREISYGEHN